MTKDFDRPLEIKDNLEPDVTMVLNEVVRELLQIRDDCDTQNNLAK